MAMYKLQKYNPDKLVWPAIASVKHDGVCGVFKDGQVFSRDGKPILSIKNPFDPNVIVLGELIVPGLDFALGAGVVRRKTLQKGIHIKVFDVIDPDYREMIYADRLLSAKLMVEHMQQFGIDNTSLVDYRLVRSDEDVQAWYEELPEGSEGLVIRHPEGIYSPGKRVWHVQKLKRMLTMTAVVVGVDRADDKKGVQTDMVGQFWCVDVDHLEELHDGNYDAWMFKVGPGSTTHEERTTWLANPDLIVGKRVEVEYMPGGGYNKPRQPILQRVRWDHE